MKYAILHACGSGIHGRVMQTTKIEARARRLIRDWNYDAYTGRHTTTYDLVKVTDDVRRGNELLYRRHGGTDYVYINQGESV